MAHIRPLNEKIIVRPSAAEEVTKGGIVLPDAVVAGKKATEGMVLAVGEGRRLPDGRHAEIKVQRGDLVIFGEYSGVKVKADDGSPLIVLVEDEILGVLEPEPAAT